MPCHSNEDDIVNLLHYSYGEGVYLRRTAFLNPTLRFFAISFIRIIFSRKDYLQKKIACQKWEKKSERYRILI